MKQKDSSWERRKNHNKRPGNQLTAAPAVDFARDSNTDEADGTEGLDGGADDPATGEEHGGSGEEAVDMMDYEEVEEEEGGNLSASLSEIETSANNNGSLHTFNDADTRVCVCELCKRRLLCFAKEVHKHEVHTVHIDGGEE